MFEDNRKMFEAWWKAGARQVFLRPNDLCAGMPFTRGLERLIYDKFQASRKFRIFGTDYDGSCGVRNIDLEYYIVARMIHAPDRSFEELENEYYSAYGAAAPAEPCRTAGYPDIPRKCVNIISSGERSERESLEKLLLN